MHRDHRHRRLAAGGRRTGDRSERGTAPPRSPRSRPPARSPPTASPTRSRTRRPPPRRSGRPRPRRPGHPTPPAPRIRSADRDAAVQGVGARDESVLPEQRSERRRVGRPVPDRGRAATLVRGQALTGQPAVPGGLGDDPDVVGADEVDAIDPPHHDVVDQPGRGDVRPVGVPGPIRGRRRGHGITAEQPVQRLVVGVRRVQPRRRLARRRGEQDAGGTARRRDAWIGQGQGEGNRQDGHDAGMTCLGRDVVVMPVIHRRDLVGSGKTGAAETGAAKTGGGRETDGAQTAGSTDLRRHRKESAMTEPSENYVDHGAEEAEEPNYATEDITAQAVPASTTHRRPTSRTTRRRTSRAARVGPTRAGSCRRPTSRTSRPRTSPPPTRRNPTSPISPPKTSRAGAGGR